MWELIRPKIAIATILADLKLAVRYGIAMHMYVSKIVDSKDRPPNLDSLPAVWYQEHVSPAKWRSYAPDGVQNEKQLLIILSLSHMHKLLIQ